MTDCHLRSNCRLCGQANFSVVLELQPSALANEFLPEPREQEKFPLTLYSCQSCHHVQLRDVVDPNRLFKHYLYVSGTSKEMRNHFRLSALKLSLEYNLQPGDLIVEIGSNDGTLLREFQHLGYRVLGIDPAENLAKQATFQGMETWGEFFTSQTAQKILDIYGHPKLVVANNCFAHADDLTDITLGVKNLIGKSGSFVFEVSYLIDMLEKGAFDQIYSEHTSYHHLGPLTTFFEKMNLVIHDVDLIGTHGGSIRVHVSHPDSGWKPKNAEDFFRIIYTEKLYLEKQIFYFTDKVSKLKEELRSTLTNLKSKGKKIAGVLASAKSTTFLHHMEIGPDILDCIADDAPEKQGKYSPGKHIPIVPFSHLKEINPDYILILSLNFADSVCQAHPEWEGRWIIPFPHLRIA